MPRRAARRAMLLATLAALACSQRRAPPPERFIPPSSPATLIVPELARAAKEMGALEGSVQTFPGAGGLAEGRRAVSAELGFDPLDPEALAAAGIDPRRGAAVAVVAPPDGAGSAVLLVLPVGDASKLGGLLLRLARDRLGATERIEGTSGKVGWVSFRRPGSATASLSYALVERTALVTTHPSGGPLVAAAAERGEDASLSSNAGFMRARAALGDGVAAAAFFPPGSPLLEGLRGLSDGAALGFASSAGRLTARAALLLGPREPAFRALAAGGHAATLVTSLDPSAPLVLRWDGNFSALGRFVVPLVPARDLSAIARSGVDLERDLFGVLAPGGAGAVLLAPRISAGAFTAEALRRDPLGAVEAEGVVPVQAGADAALAKLSRALAGRTVLPGKDGIARIRYPDGEIAWKLEGGRLAVAGGRPGRLEALLRRLAAADPGFRAPTEASKAALAGGLGGAALDVGRLVAAVRALPDEAFGGGPSAFVMRSLVERVLEPAAKVAAVSLRADLAEGALLLTLDLEAVKEEGR